jgi:hypothetical protein
MKVAIGLDNKIDDDTNSREFLRAICHLLHPIYEIHVITNGDEENKGKTLKELEKHKIQYSQLVLTNNKAKYLEKQGIEINID